MELNIRFCKEEDFTSVYGLLCQLWPDMDLNYEKLLAVYQEAIVSNKQKLIVGIYLGNILGFCSLTIKNNLWQAGNLAYIDELVVDKSYRGKGIGKQLIDKITAIAKENKCKRIELDTAFHRKDAHHFYEKIGYEKRAYKFSKIIDN